MKPKAMFTKQIKNKQMKIEKQDHLSVEPGLYSMSVGRSTATTISLF